MPAVPGRRGNGRVPTVRAAVDALPDGGPRERLRRVPRRGRGHAARRAWPSTTCGCSTPAAAAASYLTWWSDGETRRRGASLAALKARYRAAGAELDRDRAARLPARRARVRRHHRPRRRARAAAGAPRRPRAAAARPARRGHPLRRPVEAVCALLPGPSPSDVAAAKALARSGPPREQVGLELAPFGMRPEGAPGWSPEDRLVRRAALGRAALRGARRPRRRDAVALPLRQVRLDHPVLGAVRVAVAAHRQPAVPLRAARRDRRACDRAGDPEELDRRGSGCPRRPTTSRRSCSGRGRRLHAGRRRDPGLPAAHHRPRVHGHHPERQADVRRARGRASSPGWPTRCSAPRAARSTTTG